jgi:hypothetical protein
MPDLQVGGQRFDDAHAQLTIEIRFEGHRVAPKHCAVLLVWIRLASLHWNGAVRTIGRSRITRIFHNGSRRNTIRFYESGFWFD